MSTAAAAWQEFRSEREWPDREDAFHEAFMAGYKRALQDAAAAEMECQCSDECHVQRHRFLSTQRDWLRDRAAGVGTKDGDDDE